MWNNFIFFMWNWRGITIKKMGQRLLSVCLIRPVWYTLHGACISTWIISYLHVYQIKRRFLHFNLKYKLFKSNKTEIFDRMKVNYNNTNYIWPPYDINMKINEVLCTFKKWLRITKSDLQYPKYEVQKKPPMLNPIRCIDLFPEIPNNQ
jgi:hypothetical protein